MYKKATSKIYQSRRLSEIQDIILTTMTMTWLLLYYNDNDDYYVLRFTDTLLIKDVGGFLSFP